jgi:hypothetical protein
MGPMDPEDRIRSSGSTPLIAFFDADPAGWKPYDYPAFVDLGVAANAQANMVINTNFAPYIWTHVTHTIAGNIDDPETSGLRNDGQYLVRLRDERTNYTDQAAPALTLFGPHKEGAFPELPFPIFFPANHAVNIELTNIYTRVLTPVADTFRVWFVLRGMQYWGQLRPPRELLEMSKGM